MLKNISPLLTPQLLFGLAKLGHGDDVVLVDANFPADRIAEQGHALLVQLPGLSTTQVLQAVLSVLPLDTFDTPCAWTNPAPATTSKTAAAVVAASVVAVGSVPWARCSAGAWAWALS